VIDFLIETAGVSGTAGATSPAPLATDVSVACTCLISSGSSDAWTLALLT
jgi:hypothetical protein